MPRTHRRKATKLFPKFFILGAVSWAVALQCEAAAFIAHPATATRVPSTAPGHRDRVATRAASSRTPLRMAAKSGGRPIASTEQFEREVLRGGAGADADATAVPVLVLFTAPWCGPCRLTSPIVKEVLKQYQDRIEAVEISTDDLPEVAARAGVRSIPTILLYRRGAVVDTIVGCVAKNVLARAVETVLEDAGPRGREAGGG